MVSPSFTNSDIALDKSVNFTMAQLFSMRHIKGESVKPILLHLLHIIIGATINRNLPLQEHLNFVRVSVIRSSHDAT